jgi:hypothetical protein
MPITCSDGIRSLTSLSNSAGTLANTYTYDSLGSGNYYVTLAVGVLGMLIGVILGIVHRNDPAA